MKVGPYIGLYSEIITSYERNPGKSLWKGIRVIIQLALLGIPHSLFNDKPSLFSTKPSIFNYHYVNLYCKYLSFH